MISVALDLRDPQRSGLARVASSIAEAFVRGFSDEFSIVLAGPASTLRAMGATAWGRCRIVDWSSGRYAPLDWRWNRVRAKTGRAIWYYPHWDVPLNAMGDPYVMTMHDLAHLKLPGHSRLKQVVARQWIARSLARARWIMAGSRYSADEAIEVWPEIAPRTSVVYHGVDGRFFGAPPAIPPHAVERIPGASPFMLSVGIRKERKNLAIGVEVLRAVPDLRWVVVGDWYPEWETVARAARHAGVAERMIVLERQDEETLRALYAGAAFLLYPSRYEGFGLPIIEALASGIPVIAATTTSTGEVLGGAGWACDPDDVPCFVRSAREILALGARRRDVVERGRARAREFTWERSAGGLAEAFRKAAR